MAAKFLIVFEHSFTMIGRIIVANKFVGYLSIKMYLFLLNFAKSKETTVHQLYLQLEVLRLFFPNEGTLRFF